MILGGGRRSFLSTNHTDPATGEPGRREDDRDLMKVVYLPYVSELALERGMGGFSSFMKNPTQMKCRGRGWGYFYYRMC